VNVFTVKLFSRTDGFGAQADMLEASVWLGGVRQHTCLTDNPDGSGLTYRMGEWPSNWLVCGGRIGDSVNISNVIGNHHGDAQQYHNSLAEVVIDGEYVGSDWFAAQIVHYCEPGGPPCELIAVPYHTVTGTNAATKCSAYTVPCVFDPGTGICQYSNSRTCEPLRCPAIADPFGDLSVAYTDGGSRYGEYSSLTKSGTGVDKYQCDERARCFGVTLNGVESVQWQGSDSTWTAAPTCIQNWCQFSDLVLYDAHTGLAIPNEIIDWASSTVVSDKIDVHGLFVGNN
jgi:hypothetical protein